MMPPLNRVTTGTRDIDEKSIRESLRMMNQRWTQAVQKHDVRKTDAPYVNELHAELVLHTTEADERRANELLHLSEKAILRTLGNIPTSKVDTSVITGQSSTEATLVLYAEGVTVAARAYGLTSRPLDEVEDFLVKKASTEYQALLLRFYDTDALTEGRRLPLLTVKLDLTGRTLRV